MSTGKKQDPKNADEAFSVCFLRGARLSGGYENKAARKKGAEAPFLRLYRSFELLLLYQ
ncbi:hypothetical protein HMPREF3293_01705 [Christensenella minuta]|uniref:Uncharacterized protein n=1 Tax=Christensenella minuta TaxID=626937 RepID=A0A136Q494_9FIRM|nr:hypothetical protein HMPREF3293_01705 [Christensenella minuta]